eukprot:gene4718-5166_t
MSSSSNVKISPEDLRELTSLADTNRDGVLSPEEISTLIRDFNDNKITDARVIAILNRYDTNKDGVLDEKEEEVLQHEISIQDTAARYAGYSVVMARAFRYLAFTSDFGEALRPVISPRIVTGSYMVAFGYCFVDVGYEAYKHVKRNYLTEKHEHQSLTQVIVERSAFQALASLAIPAFLIHSTVSVAKRVFHRINRFQRWGPSVAGLAFIPLLPLYLDHPVEHGIEWTFKHYGPWSGDTKSKTH